jgi:putative tricarboxylic transport membrane protein
MVKGEWRMARGLKVILHPWSVTPARFAASNRAFAGSNVRRHILRIPGSPFILCAFVAIAANAQAQEWKPQKNVEIVVSTGAGGASDRQARTVQKLLQQLHGLPSVTVNNRPGGGGTVALTTLAQHPGDPHYLYVMQTGILVNRITGVATIGYQDLTPLAMLMREHINVWVKADSPIKSGQDLVARLKKDPTGLSFGFSNARGNQNHIMIAMLARAAGIDPKGVKAVVYQSGGQGVTAALGGHVDVWVGSAATPIPHLKEGTARSLGIGAAERQAGALASVPTFREQGIDAVFWDTRGFIGPRGLTPAQTGYWSGAFERMVQDEAWKQELERYVWAADFKNPAETRKFLDAQSETLAKILAELGLVNR